MRPAIFAKATVRPAGARRADRLVVRAEDSPEVPEFLKDLMKPEYTRTRRNISAVINFAKFREEKVADYEETQAEHDAADKRLADAKKRNAELKAEIARIQAERDEEKDSVERQKALRDEWAAKAKDAEAERNVVAEQKAAVEQALAAVKANEDATKAKVLEAEAGFKALVDLIVHHFLIFLRISLVILVEVLRGEPATEEMI